MRHQLQSSSALTSPGEWPCSGHHKEAGKGRDVQITGKKDVMERKALLALAETFLSSTCPLNERNFNAGLKQKEEGGSEKQRPFKGFFLWASELMPASPLPPTSSESHIHSSA